MKAHLYKIACLTNLHVGNEGSSYSIVDKEVERDFNGLPIIHSSGIKGALRSLMTLESASGVDDIIEHIFGKPAKSGEGSKGGTYTFMDAHLLCRPLRVRNSPGMTYIPVVTISMIKDFLRLTKSFGCCPVSDVDNSLVKLDELAKSFDITGNENIQFFSSEADNQPLHTVEDEETKPFPNGSEIVQGLLKFLIGDHFAVARSLDDYNLPVIARNNLGEIGNRNLWYEQYVPHTSCFYTIILIPDNEKNQIPLENYVQIGGNASVGYGFVKFEEISEPAGGKGQ